MNLKTWMQKKSLQKFEVGQKVKIAGLDVDVRRKYFDLNFLAPVEIENLRGKEVTVVLARPITFYDHEERGCKEDWSYDAKVNDEVFQPCTREKCGDIHECQVLIFKELPDFDFLSIWVEPLS